MITVLDYGKDGVEVVRDPGDISDLLGHEGRLLWVDLSDPTDEDFACIAAEFDLHPLAMEDARKHGQRPKLERYPTHVFVVAYSEKLAEVDLFVGPDWLVTVRGANEDGDRWQIDEARRRFERTRVNGAAVGLLLYTILDELVDGYFRATDIAEDELETLEDRIFGEDVPDEREVQHDLFEIRRRLLHFRRAVVPLRDVINALLRREVPWIDDQTVLLLQDVYDHVLRVIDLVDTQRELMGNAVDAHLAIISNHMNEVMKTMTSWGALLLGSTLIAGIYGMNFEHMPELGWQFGYPMAIGLMVLLTVTGFVAFRRRDWL
ncbi:MAG: magnesium/cobalt transporter CorA [Actinobacteria bacterium]|nr:magnesium/cobalt transporter CorA [Actinomycetota bacterium]